MVLCHTEKDIMSLSNTLLQGNPGKDCARNWSMAMELQDVDRLRLSEFLLE